MKSITQNILSYLEIGVLNSSGKPQTGLVVTYTIHKCSDNSLLTSGAAGEIGVTGVYAFSYTFTVLAEYTLHWISPTNYEDGFEDLNVIAPEIVANDVWNELTAALLTPNSIGKLLVDNIDAPISGITGTTPAQIWDYLLAAILTPGSIGECIKINLDAPISGITSVTPSQIWEYWENSISDHNSIGYLIKYYIKNQDKKSFILPVANQYKKK